MSEGTNPALKKHGLKFFIKNNPAQHNKTERVMMRKVVKLDILI